MRHLALAAALAVSTLAHANTLVWPPLFEGQPKASFHASARIMASAGQQDVTLHYGLFGLQSLGMDELEARVAPLVDRLEAAHAIRVYAGSRLSDRQRMLGAVLFMVSVSPDIVLAVPDELPETWAGLIFVNYLGQPSIERLMHQFNLAYTCSANEHLMARERRSFDGDGPYYRTNTVLVSRVVLDRPGSWVVSAEGAFALPEDRRFEVAGHRFQFKPLPGQPGLPALLELQPAGPPGPSVQVRVLPPSSPAEPSVP